MAKDLVKYYRVWQLRQEGKTLKEIGQVMGFSLERARIMANYINFIMKKRNKDYLELKKLING